MKAAIRTPLMYHRRQGHRSAFVALLAACWLMALFGLDGGRTFSLLLIVLTMLVLLLRGLVVARRRRVATEREHR